jgi:phosphodiesterase/alkaline phosphatase D-like protein
MGNLRGETMGEGVSRRRRWARLIVRWSVPALAMCTLLLGASRAQAATGHKFLDGLTEAPGGSKIGEPDAVAVEQSSGRVFVADRGRGVVDVFSAAGGYESQFGAGALFPVGVAVDELTHDVYVAEGFGVGVFKPDGKGGYGLLSEWTGANAPHEAGEEGFGELSAVAIDNSTSASDPHAGDVYLVDGVNNAVYAFKPKPEGAEEAKEGSFVASLAGGTLEAPNAVAVDSATGSVYVADSIKGLIDVYGPSGSLEKKLTGAGSPEGSFSGPEAEEGNVTAVSIDEATGEIYVAEAQRRVLSQFNPEGKWIGWTVNTPSGPLGEPCGVAITPSGGVYLADAQAHLVDVFGPDVIVPDAKTGAASKVARTSAILHGLINGDGKVAKYRFQLGQSEALGSETSSQPAGAGEEKASAEMNGLKAGTPYFFRLVTENEDGVNYGALRQFTTAPPVEGLSTGPAEAVTTSEATVTGALTPNGIETHYYFQWGKTSAYGNSTPPGTASAGKEAVKSRLSGLTPNTTYHYRLVGENELGTTSGEDTQFTTSGPPRVTSEATSVEGHEAATIHARVNPDKLETKYHFEYGETTAYGTEVPHGGAIIAAGEAPVAESAPLTGLKIGTTYHFRVVASNAAGTTFGPDQAFTTVPSAPIESLSAGDVSSSEATLQTRINPLGHDTTYFFEYGTESCAEHPAACTNVPGTPTDIGMGETGVPQSVRVEGLKPASTYHYRVLATNSLGTTDSAERTFTTQEAEKPFVLADNRAFEMVSPPDKHGAPIEALTREGGLILAAEDGNSLSYLADDSIVEQPQGNRSPEMQQVLARRGSEKWSSQDIATPNTAAQGYAPGAPQEYQFFTPDLSLALVEPYGVAPFSEPPLAPGARQKTIYLRNDEAGTFLPLVTEANVPAETVFGKKIHFLTATPDLSHVVLRSEVALTPPPSGRGLYEWSAGKLTFVSLLPEGSQGTPAPAVELGFAGHVLAHAVSNDGTRVIWTSQNAGPGHLYMRDTATAQTIQLDAAQGAPEPPGAGSARFQSASTDGSRVFFTDPQRLTADSTADATHGKADLYECEMAEAPGGLACHLKDLTVPGNQDETAAVQGFLFGAAQDGSSVYFVAQGVLAENKNGNGETAQPGKDNLYALREYGGTWTTTFIAALAGEDSPEWEGNGLADSAFLTARVSPNGGYLAFMTAASPTGYDNVDQHSGEPDEEVYLYEAASKRLTCASCNPSGARPAGIFDTNESGEGRGLLVDRRKVWDGHWLAANIPGWTAQSLTSALFQPRYLSDAGRLFFNSPDHLVPAATNGRENVYEYEPSGVGSCDSPSGACVSLISPGSSGRESAFLEATPSGDDVFFLTAAQLLPQDTDTAFDVYDARVCTEQSPCQSPLAPEQPGCGSTETCRPASPSLQAPLGPSGTATVSASDNLTSQPNSGHLDAKTSKPKPLTRAQKLARALKACKRYRSKRKRQACIRRAHRAYGARHTARKAVPVRGRRK